MGPYILGGAHRGVRASVGQTGFYHHAKALGCKTARILSDESIGPRKLRFQADSQVLLYSNCPFGIWLIQTRDVERGWRKYQDRTMARK